MKLMVFVIKNGSTEYGLVLAPESMGDEIERQANQSGAYIDMMLSLEGALKSNNVTVLLPEAIEQGVAAELLPRCGMCGGVAEVSHHYCKEHSP